MTNRQRNWFIFLIAWVLISFAVASYHPPRTLADRVLARAGRYETWQFDLREDAGTLLAVLLPGLLVGGFFLWRARKS